MWSLLAASTLLHLAPAPAPQDPPEPRVALELLADVEAIAPGAELSLLVRLSMPREWHVYWTNPGDSGAPTRVTVSGPTGFEIGEPRFPGPDPIEQAGGLLSFGYEEELVVFVPVRAPQALRPGRPLVFTASADWLVCHGVCFAQSGSTGLVLPASFRAAEASPRPAAGGLVERWRPRLPRSLTELTEARTLWTRPDGGGALLEIALPGAGDARFLPGPDAPLDLPEPRLERGETGPSVSFVFPGDPPFAVSGLLRLEGPDGPRFFDVSLSEPKTEPDPGR